MPGPPFGRSVAKGSPCINWCTPHNTGLALWPAGVGGEGGIGVGRAALLLQQPPLRRFGGPPGRGRTRLLAPAPLQLLPPHLRLNLQQARTVVFPVLWSAKSVGGMAIKAMS